MIAVSITFSSRYLLGGIISLRGGTFPVLARRHAEAIYPQSEARNMDCFNAMRFAMTTTSNDGLTCHLTQRFQFVVQFLRGKRLAQKVIHSHLGYAQVNIRRYRGR